MITKRLPLPDLLKGFAVFLIIPLHILETFIDYPGRQSLFGKILLVLGGPIVVPVFMLVMGYFVAASRKNTKQHIFRGVLIFILGIILNVGLNFNLLLKIEYQGWQFDKFQYIFGVDIFPLAGLSIIVLVLLKNLTIWQQWITLALILFVSAATAHMNQILLVTDINYILPFIGGKYSWSYFPLFPWLAYPLIGFWFQNNEARIMDFMHSRKIATAVFYVLILILVTTFANFGIAKTINLAEYYHHTFPFFLWTMGIDILWILAICLVVQKFSEFPPIIFLRWLGKNITAFYVVQWLIIGNIATAIYHTQSLSVYGYWFGGIFLVTIGITWMLEKIQQRAVMGQIK